MIVKVQISQYSSDGEKKMLVYNEDRSVEYEDVATKEVLKKMGKSPKKYFEAEVIPHPKNWLRGESVVNLIKETKPQSW